MKWELKLFVLERLNESMGFHFQQWPVGLLGAIVHLEQLDNLEGSRVISLKALQFVRQQVFVVLVSQSEGSPKKR